MLRAGLGAVRVARDPGAPGIMLLLLLLVVTAARAREFNVTYLNVPQEVQPSQAEVEIECRYEGNFTLLNWFKGPNEFFRYKPGAAPSIRSFPILGIGRIEMVECGPITCRLRLGALTEEATGLYRCDIERDVVPYKFATKSAYMIIRGHQHRQPLLEGLASEFGEGDEMRAYCRADHYTEVRWYINAREIKEMRGSRAFTHKSTRLLFSGVPPTVTVQCAEVFNGKLSGSKEAKAHWIDPIQTYGDETAQEQRNNARSVYPHTFVITVFTLSINVRYIFEKIF